MLTFLRFAAWNVGVRLCDLTGSRLNRFALWFERTSGRESRIYGCLIHPDWLLPAYDSIPSSWWARFGWNANRGLEPDPSPDTQAES